MRDLVVLPMHGVGGRSDLPIPFTLAVTAAAVALVVSFVALAFLWHEPRLGRPDAGWALPGVPARVYDSSVTHWVVRLLGLAFTGYVLAAALFGMDDALNPTAGVVFVLFWVGAVAFASFFFGPVWRWLNPVRTLYLAGCALLRRDHRAGLLPYPPRLGNYPAAAGIFAFAWLELVAPQRDTLPVLRAWFGAYAVLMLMGAVVYGSTWFDRGDGFQVASALYGRLSVIGRRAGGTAVLRNPLDGAASTPKVPGLPVLVSVMLGTTAYDGMSNATFWVRFVQDSSLPQVLLQTLGLAAGPVIFGSLYAGAVWLAGRLGDASSSRSMPAEFAHSIVPIAFGYLFAHYYSFFIIAGQTTIQQLADPLGTGADFFGLGDRGVSFAWVVPGFVATLAVTSVVLGHVVGVVLAHDRAVGLFPRKAAVIGQLPLLALMVAYTVAGLILLFSG
jgi:hypothetical protein